MSLESEGARDDRRCLGVGLWVVTGRQMGEGSGAVSGASSGALSGVLSGVGSGESSMGGGVG